MRLLFIYLVFISFIAASQTKEDTIKYDDYTAKAVKYYYTHPDSNRIYSDSLLYVYRTKGLGLAGVKGLQMKGVYYHLASDYDSALISYKESLNISRNLKDTASIARSLLNCGIVFFIQSEFDSSLFYNSRALKFFRQKKDTLNLAKAIGEIAKVYSLMGDHAVALEYFNEELAFVKRLNNELGLGNSYSNLNTVHNYLENYDSSIFFGRKAIPIFRKYNNLGGLNTVYQNLANIFKAQEKYDSAIHNYQLAIECVTKIGYTKGLGETYYNIGGMELLRGRYKSALQNYSIAIPFLLETKDQRILSFTYRDKSEIFKKLKQFDSAYQNHVKYKFFADSAQSLEKEKYASELQTQYETEKKEQRIALQEAQLSEQEAEIVQSRYLTLSLIVTLVSLLTLWLLNRNRLKKKQQILLQQEKLKTQDAEIKATIASQEKERARYARDLHDGFGQMISILNMNLGSLKQGAKPKERQIVFEESEKVINEMYDELKGICFDLMPQTLVRDGIQSGLHEFAERINKAGQVFIETNFFGLEHRLSEVQEISLYRISQEWTNNILKYSDADKITIQITRDHREITLLIEDNGTGFDKALLIHSEGNGWKNLTTRTNVMQGKLELETLSGKKGNTLIVNAPAQLEYEKVNYTNTISTV